MDFEKEVYVKECLQFKTFQSKDKKKSKAAKKSKRTEIDSLNLNYPNIERNTKVNKMGFSCKTLLFYELLLCRKFYTFFQYFSDIAAYAICMLSLKYVKGF